MLQTSCKTITELIMYKTIYSTYNIILHLINCWSHLWSTGSRVVEKMMLSFCLLQNVMGLFLILLNKRFIK